METGTPVITSTPPATATDEVVDDGRGSFGEGWFCVATDPFPCPAESCGFVANFMTAAHLVVVWPSADDSALLGAAANAREAKRNPRVVEYESSMGPCISWDEWERIGQPVHAVLNEKPEGWLERPWRL